jgi:3-oxoacyl-[acyl-carrier protein] reductase
MPGMDLYLRDRVYLVTGGSRGLGRATAEVLVGEGASVVVSARHEDVVLRTASALGTSRALGVAADIADPHSAERLVAAAVSRFGRIDGALVSVGGPPGGPGLAVSDEEWRAGFESVFLGAVRVVRAVVSAVTGEGSIALVLSSSVREPVPGLALGNGLRPGLAGLAKTLADELGPSGVRINGLLPGRIATDRLVELDAASGDGAAARERNEERIPLRRYGTPQEFGRVAAFVLSPAAAYLTGTMLPIDGGLLRSF